MLSQFVQKIIGTRNERILKQYAKHVQAINALEPQMQAKSDELLKKQTGSLRERATNGESLDHLLPEAFATVREAGVRALDMRHFDVQLMGAMAMHQGKIAEMRTGEGKTLVATLAAYLNALSGNGVHIVTVNDYLARRDAAWMRKLYDFLNMSVYVVVPGMSPNEKRAAYAADIIYGTNNEYGFDYLRDNMAFSAEEKTQGSLTFAIVDEVDSILIDEARTPLIISGPTEESSELYTRIDRLIPMLNQQQEEDGPGDFSVDEKSKQVHLTEEGHQNVEELLVENRLLDEGESLYDPSRIALMHHFNAALRAHALFHRNVDYIVQGNEIVIVDEFTGRTMEGRRWSDGLHQAIEAKEEVTIQQENQTLGSITFQNYFRMYEKLAGMTGTADTEAAEFQQIYGLEVLIIPTHLKMVRDDRSDLVYLSKKEKFDAILDEIRNCRQRGQPTLVGTASIDTSEMLSRLLNEEKIDHQVLNAKQHAREATIIAQAGRPGAVTIATNMAGRGTDIVLGGNWQTDIESTDEVGVGDLRQKWQVNHDKVLHSGGLHIIGTERHESRRVDNQLRGRAGRQGDPGSSRFFLSLEDDLMRIFASERVKGLMEKLGMEEGEAIEHKWVTKAIENAQRKVEGRNFDIRKQLLEYDDVANDQRKEIYSLRNELMLTDDVSEMVDAILKDTLKAHIDTFIPPESLDELWDIPGLEKTIDSELGLRLDISGWLEAEEDLYEEPLRERIYQEVKAAYVSKTETASAEVIRTLEKAVMLQVLDSSWKEHLAAMDYLRQGIHLRGYAQKNPKQEYKREAFEMFNMLLEKYKSEVVGILTKGQIQAAPELGGRPAPEMEYHHDATMGLANRPSDEKGSNTSPGAAPFVRPGRKIGRNELCPCGSGKKYKSCHGRLH